MLNLFRWSFEIVDKTSMSATPYKNSPLELIIAEKAAVLAPFFT